MAIACFGNSLALSSIYKVEVLLKQTVKHQELQGPAGIPGVVHTPGQRRPTSSYTYKTVKQEDRCLGLEISKSQMDTCKSIMHSTKN